MRGTARCEAVRKSSPAADPVWRRDGGNSAKKIPGGETTRVGKPLASVK